MAEREIKTKDYLEKLYKLIPIEMTGAYVAGSSIVSSHPQAPNLWYILVIFAVILFVINPIFLRRVQKVSNKRQLILSTISFPIWAANTSIEWFSGSGPVALVLALTLIVWTLVIPIVEA
ncbi:MAG: hypothetical protein K5872_10530 [Rhizobiaceae bacterium]|nr:hypothetical protein [Rhizobiaceae bacterium]MCV0406652.1 hypothetical protein [Rhizobiaceae bacterium]